METLPNNITTSAPPSKQLYLVRHNQAEGEPLHWSLETADVEGGDLDGNVYQVSGDAEFMDYRPYQVRKYLKPSISFDLDAFNMHGAEVLNFDF